MRLHALPGPVPGTESIVVLVDHQLRRAIAERRLIEFSYQAILRVAEPHDCGVQQGTVRLLVYQIRSMPFARGWRLLDVRRSSGSPCSTRRSPAVGASATLTTINGTRCLREWSDAHRGARPFFELPLGSQGLGDLSLGSRCMLPQLSSAYLGEALIVNVATTELLHGCRRCRHRRCTTRCFGPGLFLRIALPDQPLRLTALAARRACSSRAILSLTPPTAAPFV
jgi:hypothetical protein